MARGSRIPSGKRIINSVAPLNPSDFSEANALNLMFLWDNIGTGAYLEDTSILLRHLAMLRVREQASPNLTLEVNPGIAWFSQNSYVNYAGGNTPTITAPAVNPRRDIITIRNDGTIHVLNGAEGVSPVAPTIPSTDIALAQVFSRVGQTAVYDNDDQVGGQGYVEYDLRPFTQVAVGASAMPKIGLVARTQVALNSINGDTGFVDVVNFAGAGRLNSAHFTTTGAGGTMQAQYKIIVDGVTLFTSSLIAISGGGNISDDIMKAATDQAANLTLLAQTGTPANDNPKGTDLFFFKSSLQIQQRLTGNTVAYTSTGTVDWEHE